MSSGNPKSDDQKESTQKNEKLDSSVLPSTNGALDSTIPGLNDMRITGK